MFIETGLSQLFDVLLEMKLMLRTWPKRRSLKRFAGLESLPENQRFSPGYIALPSILPGTISIAADVAQQSPLMPWERKEGIPLMSLARRYHRSLNWNGKSCASEFGRQWTDSRNRFEQPSPFVRWKAIAMKRLLPFSKYRWGRSSLASFVPGRNFAHSSLRTCHES